MIDYREKEDSTTFKFNIPILKTKSNSDVLLRKVNSLFIYIFKEAVEKPLSEPAKIAVMLKDLTKFK